MALVVGHQGGPADPSRLGIRTRRRQRLGTQRVVDVHNRLRVHDLHQPGCPRCCVRPPIGRGLRLHFVEHNPRHPPRDLLCCLVLILFLLDPLASFMVHAGDGHTRHCLARVPHPRRAGQRAMGLDLDGPGVCGADVICLAEGERQEANVAAHREPPGAGGGARAAVWHRHGIVIELRRLCGACRHGVALARILSQARCNAFAISSEVRDRRGDGRHHGLRGVLPLATSCAPVDRRSGDRRRPPPSEFAHRAGVRRHGQPGPGTHVLRRDAQDRCRAHHDRHRGVHALVAGGEEDLEHRGAIPSERVHA
mmetsp:Transcript_57/g.151  ORF Transcript_57/g.151 Transcript_57/m.151 type:complete len:309 (-) Transcript_57:12-938(-)